MSAGFSDTKSTTTTQTTNTDKRLTTTSGEILALQDSDIRLRDQGQITFISSNADLARAAIEAVSRNAANITTAVGDTVKQLATGSNKIAADVAKSQEQFVATASGQKYVLYALAGIVGLVMLPTFFKGSK